MNLHIPHAPKLLPIVALAAILACGLGLRFLGSDWPPLHPDDHKLTKWVKRTSIQAFVTDQVYPNGFFVLLRPIQWLALGRLDRNSSRTAGDMIPVDIDRKILLLVRVVNAWLGMASAFLAFLLARRVFDSDGAGLVAAWAVAFHPFHVEHCHYIETEAAMVFTLFLALLAWAGYLSNRRCWTILAAALLSGFAAGTKFTSLLLLPLVFLPLFHGVEPKSRLRPWAWILAGLAAFVAGFIAANIAVAVEPEWFFVRLGVDAAGTFSESRKVIGQAFGEPMARFTHQLRWLGNFMGAWKALPLAAGAAGMVMWFGIDRARTFRSIAWLFPVLFAAYLIFKAPWIRMQETFNFLPAFALAAGALFVASMAALRSGALMRRALGGAGAMLLILAGLTLLCASVYRAQLFAWQDSRFAAGQWLKLHMNADRALGLERYTKATHTLATPVPLTVTLDKIEDHDGPNTRLAQVDFVLRNETFPDRGRFDPFTGGRYSHFVERHQAFLDAFQPLRAWSPCPPEDEASFAFVNPELILYGRIVTPIPTQTVTMPLPRPILVTDKPASYSQLGHCLGAAWAVPLTGKGATVAVGGPEDHPGPIYAVIFTEDEPANVSVSGRGDSAFVQLGQWGSVAVELKRSRFRPRLDPFERIHARTVSGSRVEKGHTYLMLAFTPEEALWLTLQLGSRMKALDFMDLVGLNADLVSKGPDILLGGARIRATDHALQRIIRRSRLEIATVMYAPPESVGIYGVNGRVFEDFNFINGVLGTNAFRLAPAPADATYACRTGFPALFPPGKWTVSLDLSATLPSNALADIGSVPLSITMPDGDLIWQAPVSNGWQNMEFTWISDAYMPFEIVLCAPVPLTLVCRRSAVSWPLRRQLENASKLFERTPALRATGGALGVYLAD